MKVERGHWPSTESGELGTRKSIRKWKVRFFLVHLPSLLVEVGQAFVAPRVPVTVVAPQRTRMSGESTARQSAATWSSIASCAGRSSGSSLWHCTYKSHLIGKQVILGHTTCPNELEPLILVVFPSWNLFHICHSMFWVVRFLYKCEGLLVAGFVRSSRRQTPPTTMFFKQKFGGPKKKDCSFGLNILGTELRPVVFPGPRCTVWPTVSWLQGGFCSRTHQLWL